MGREEEGFAIHDFSAGKKKKKNGIDIAAPTQERGKLSGRNRRSIFFWRRKKGKREFLDCWFGGGKKKHNNRRKKKKEEGSRTVIRACTEKKKKVCASFSEAGQRGEGRGTPRKGRKKRRCVVIGTYRKGKKHDHEEEEKM